MKILLATDGSEHSNAAVEEIANCPFQEGMQLLVLSAYENTSVIVSESAVMGGLAGGYEEAGNIVMNLAEKAVKMASETIKEKNPALSISAKVIIDFPKEGISSANWNKDTKLLVVSYDSGKITNYAIQKKIASVGHEKYKAEDTVYEKLPDCCHYDSTK